MRFGKKKAAAEASAVPVQPVDWNTAVVGVECLAAIERKVQNMLDMYNRSRARRAERRAIDHRALVEWVHDNTGTPLKNVPWYKAAFDCAKQA